MSKKHFVYILECSDNTLYCGYTTDLDRRIFEHNHTNKGAKYTRGRRPVKLVYQKSYSTRSKANTAENNIKSLSRMQKIALIEN